MATQKARESTEERWIPRRKTELVLFACCEGKTSGR